jgi:hypothetical protein
VPNNCLLLNNFNVKPEVNRWLTPYLLTRSSQKWHINQWWHTQNARTDRLLLTGNIKMSSYGASSNVARGSSN